MADLGSLLMGGDGSDAAPPTPGASDAAPADAHGQWMDWLQNPTNRAGLLSFGLSALSGGWGSGRQRMAQAIGAGAEGASGAQAIQDKESDTAFNQDLENRKLKQQSDLESQKEAGALERTKLLADSRSDVAKIRGQGGGSMSKYEQTFYNQVYTGKQKDLTQAATLGLAKNADGTDMSAEDISAIAAKSAEDAILSRRSLYGDGSAPGLQAPSAAAPGAGTTPPATPAPASGQGQGTAPRTYEDLASKSGMDRAHLDAWAKTPQGKTFMQSQGITGAPQ